LGVVSFLRKQVSVFQAIKRVMLVTDCHGESNSQTLSKLQHNNANTTEVDLCRNLLQNSTFSASIDFLLFR